MAIGPEGKVDLRGTPRAGPIEVREFVDATLKGANAGLALMLQIAQESPRLKTLFSIKHQVGSKKT